MASRSPLPLTPLLLAIAALAPAGEAAPGQPGGADAAASTAGIDRAAADAKYADALGRYRAGAFAEALELVRQALALDPDHMLASRLRSDVQGVLNFRDSRLRMAAEWFGSLQDVRTEETAVRLNALLEKADSAMAAGDYGAAELDYDRVEVGIRTFPYRFDWGELPKALETKRLEARDKARQRALQRQSDDRRAAAEESVRQARLHEEALRLKVDELMRRAQTAFDRKDYRRAEIEAWNAYELDRRREDARDLYLAARAEHHYQFDIKYREERLEGLARVAEEVHKSLIPQNELMVYPEDWQRRALRQPKEIGTQKAEPWMAALNDRLEQRVTFDFQDTGFEDVVAFLRQVTGVNIVVAPAVLAGTAGGGAVTLRVRDMRFRDALKWILEITNLKMAIQDQAIFISDQAVSGAAALRLYDVTDLISPVQNFPGPELAYNAGSGTSANLFGATGGAADTAAQSPDQLVEFIRKNVTPGEWAPEKNIDIQQRSGSTLFVSHTPEGHRLVEQLLANLRSQSAMQVNIGVRLLDVRKGFFEEIGVDWTNNPVGMINRAPPSAAGFRQMGSNGALGAANSAGYLIDGSVVNSGNLPGNAANYSGANRGLLLEGAMNPAGFFNAEQVNAVFSAAEDETDATILNNPTLTCFNGQQAHAAFIRQLAYIADYDGNWDPQISVVNYGDLLDVRPVVSSDRKYITMEVRPTSVDLEALYREVIQAADQLNNGGNVGVVVLIVQAFPIELPNLRVRTLRSTVMLPDRGSLLLGGYNRSLRQRTHVGVPFLSHIPFVGRLFSRNGTYDDSRQLYYLLTATVLDIGETEQRQ